MLHSCSIYSCIILIYNLLNYHFLTIFTLLRVFKSIYKNYNSGNYKIDCDRLINRVMIYNQSPLITNSSLSIYSIIPACQMIMQKTYLIILIFIKNKSRLDLHLRKAHI